MTTMTQALYDYNKMKERCKLRTTEQLTPDQFGWAKQRYPVHFRKRNAKWFIRPEKPAVPLPAIKPKKTT